MQLTPYRRARGSTPRERAGGAGRVTRLSRPQNGRVGAPRVAVVTNGVSLLQTHELYSTYWSYFHGHALPPNWSKASHPAWNGGAHDHPRFYHRVVLRGR